MSGARPCSFGAVTLMKQHCRALLITLVLGSVGLSAINCSEATSRAQFREQADTTHARELLGGKFRIFSLLCSRVHTSSASMAPLQLLLDRVPLAHRPWTVSSYKSPVMTLCTAVLDIWILSESTALFGMGADT